MPMCQRASVAVAFALAIVAFSSSLAKYPFVNDFEAYPQDSRWEFTEYYDIVIDENDIVTVFWGGQIEHPLYSGFHHIYYRKFTSAGVPLTDPMMITDSSRYSIYAFIQVGHNRKGKWATANSVIWNCQEYPWCPRGLMAWVSNDQGLFTDSGFPVGNEVQPIDHNYKGRAGVDSAGNFLIVWAQGSSPPEVLPNIWCQLFWADKTPRSDTIRVTASQLVNGLHYYMSTDPKVAMTPGGDFVVIWGGNSENQPPLNGNQEIYMRLFHADGTPKSAELCASCDGDTLNRWANHGKYGDVAIADNGDFAITYTQLWASGWCLTRVAMRRFNADGTPKGQQLVLDSLLCDFGFGIMSYISSDSAGNLLVVWQDDKPDGGLCNLQARRFNAAGESVGEHFFRINDSDKKAGVVATPVDLNNHGLAGFFWPEFLSDYPLVQRDMVQLMDYSDVGFYICGDANNDRLKDISDAVYLIAYIFTGGQSPANVCCGDASGDQFIDISDVVVLVNYIFGGGTIPGLCPGQ